QLRLPGHDPYRGNRAPHGASRHDGGAVQRRSGAASSSPARRPPKRGCLRNTVPRVGRGFFHHGDATPRRRRVSGAVSARGGPMGEGIQFGFCVPIFANPGMIFFRTPSYERLDWPTTRDAVLECEALGYDSVFVADHVFLGREGAIYEGWTVLAALAGMTNRL